MLKLNLLLVTTLLISGSTLFAQNTQTIRGYVGDIDNDFPLDSVNITVEDRRTHTSFKAVTDSQGVFSISYVPVGKYNLIASSETHAPVTMSVIVDAGRESILDVKMNELIKKLNEVVISSKSKQSNMALTSSRQFTIEETERYAGSRADVARMVANFAGVQGSDDTRNDIVVRSNSPLSVIYKVNGIDIPNPSHFAVAGTMGGPLTILNNKALDNSNFLLSAFPAEYGNTISGIFDLKLRNGNAHKTEYTGQFGLFGTELLAEGPLNKKKGSSFLVTARYSTLSIFKAIGIKLGTNATPVYGDAQFKLNFPLKNGGQLSVWGIGGKSDIDILISDQTEIKEGAEDIYAKGDRDQFFGTTMAIGGVTYQKLFSNGKTRLAATIAGSYDEQDSYHEYLKRSLDLTSEPGKKKIRIDNRYEIASYNYRTTRLLNYVSITHKFNVKHIIKAGLNFDVLNFNMIDSVLNTSHTAFINRWDYRGSTVLIQPFIQWNYKVTDDFRLTLGLHSQYFSLSKSVSYVEPRLGLKYALPKGNTLSFSAGLHSQTQPYYTYSYHKLDNANNKIYENMNMDFSRSAHFVLGYEKKFDELFSILTEVYYQHLYNVPVTKAPSSFSMLNQGAGFQRFFPDALQNTGLGTNYGIEVTVQKYFNRSFFILLSSSLYDSKYKGSDNIERKTSYNGLYIVNFIGSKEFNFGKRHSLVVGTKITTSGGRSYGYPDLDKTKLNQELVWSDSAFNSRQYKNYFRVDLKLVWKIQGKKHFTQEVGLDLVNLLGRKNILGLTYGVNLEDPTKEPIVEQYQLGFLPIFYYRIGI